jgi:hypothetical protein
MTAGDLVVGRRLTASCGANVVPPLLGEAVLILGLTVAVVGAPLGAAEGMLGRPLNGAVVGLALGATEDGGRFNNGAVVGRMGSPAGAADGDGPLIGDGGAAGVAIGVGMDAGASVIMGLTEGGAATGMVLVGRMVSSGGGTMREGEMLGAKVGPLVVGTSVVVSVVVRMEGGLDRSRMVDGATVSEKVGPVVDGLLVGPSSLLEGLRVFVVEEPDGMVAGFDVEGISGYEFRNQI